MTSRMMMGKRTIERKEGQSLFKVQTGLLALKLGTVQSSTGKKMPNKAG